AESFFKLPEGSLSHVRENLSKVWVDKKTDVYYKIDLSKTAEEANRYKQYIEALKEIGADRFAVLPEVAVIPIAADGVEYGIVSSIQKSAGVEGNLVRQLAGKAFTRKDDMLFGQLYDQNATTKNDHDGILKSEIGTGLTNAGLVIGKDGMARAYAFDFDGMGDDKLSIDEVKRLSQEVLASVLDMSGVPLEEFSPEVQKIIRDNQAGSSLVNK
ncbi:MAG: hypothetical protein WCL61_02860, partial [bacterium]